MKAILFLLAFFSYQIVYAGLDIVSVSGGSFSEENTSGIYTLYGGLAGACTSPSTTSTCNTCTNTGTTPPIACNTLNIHSTLVISVSIVTTSSISNKTVEIRTGTADAAAATTIAASTITTTASQTTTVPITFDWGDICNLDATVNSSSCTGSSGATPTHFDSNRKVFVWVDEDNDGTVDDGESKYFYIKFQYIDITNSSINQQEFCSAGDSSKIGMCGFQLGVGGDSKLYIQDLYSSGVNGGAPQNYSGAPDWYGIALFTVAGASTTAISTGAISPLIQTLDTDYYLNDNTITGLENYTQYCVVMGNVNKAQNIFLLNTGGVFTTAQVCGTPSEVVGLLDDKSCFISTAAFGSDMAVEVETFRKFRNHFLLTNSYGSYFVKLYYKYSPPLANFIAQSDTLRFVVRMTLYPIYYFSVVSLKYGVLYALLLLVLLVLIIQKIRSNIRASQVKWFVLFLFAVFVKPQTTYAVLTETKPVQHPGAAADGLVKIDKDGNYIYKQLPQSVTQASHLRLGTVSNPDISTEICDVNGLNCQQVNFDDIYDGASDIGLEYDYEYFLFTGSKVNVGKLAVQGGVAINYAKGYGRLVSDPTQQSVESFTFITMPLFAGLLYRFEYKDRQVFVPYVAGGGVYAVLAEKREDRSKVNAIGAPGFYGSGGALLNISAIDREMGSDFESEYGIQNLWISAEFKYISVNSEVFELQNGYVQGGLGFDF